MTPEKGRGPKVGAAALLGLACAGTACAPGGGPSPVAPTPAPSPNVVILSVDGLRPDALSDASTPSILGLARRGAATWSAQTILPSNTLPAHASMLSGYEPKVHRLAWDDYRPERGVITVPTLFSAARRAGLRTVMVVGKEKLRHLDADAADTFVLARSDQDVANEAIVQLGTHFDLLFGHFPDTDLAGHVQGWMSPSYIEQLSRTDRAIGRLLAALPAHATVILSADHGGSGKVHGSATPLDLTIPWIMAGPDVPEGVVILRRVRTVDTAATAARVLGIQLAADVSGVPVLEAFRPAPAARAAQVPAPRSGPE